MENLSTEGNISQRYSKILIIEAIGQFEIYIIIFNTSHIMENQLY